ncbi:MAG: 1-deoxy-D-xylulose-5-phosphate reductoisomerase [Candidatus Symbiobacter sp.]|nr:1-deoxy-D-xylulose-5-phosphate reductoisomerase [Candidatus Symbiobacter sp.]
MTLGTPPYSPRSVTILGSTGSVGQNAVELIDYHQGQFTVEAVTAHRNVALLAAQALKLRAKLAVIADPDLYPSLCQALAGSGIKAAAGEEAVIEAALYPAELVVAALVGSVGLKPCLTAIERGAILAFANKEVLVSAGDLVMQQVKKNGATLLPIDSEHNAIFQIYDPHQRDHIRRIILTASGGPFRTWSREAMAAAQPDQALRHPNWSMGAKITIDSATMMNKGLEIIEAHYLFGLAAAKIDVVIHPQSIIHSMLEYEDGSILAELGAPDMRTPIAHALAWPRRMSSTSSKLDLLTIADLQFFAPDLVKFPALNLARNCLLAGGAAPTIMNAANEIAVAAFLARQIGFAEITALVDQALNKIPNCALTSLEDILAIDFATRQTTLALIKQT